MTAAINTQPAIGRMRFIRRPVDAEDIPIGTTIRTPTGALAQVINYRGFRRDHRIRLVCRYIKPVNKAFDVVLLLPELVTVVEKVSA